MPTTLVLEGGYAIQIARRNLLAIQFGPKFDPIWNSMSIHLNVETPDSDQTNQT